VTETGNQRLQLFFHQSPLGFIEWNKDWKVIGWNSAAAAMFEYSEAEALGIEHLQLIPTSDQHQVNQVIERLEHHRGGRFSENNNCTKSGKVIRCRWYNTILLDEHGEQIGAASVVQDITREVEEHKRLLSYYERLNEFSHNLLELSQRRSFTGEQLETTIRELTEFGAKALKVSRASSWLLNRAESTATAITTFDTHTLTHTPGATMELSDYKYFFERLCEERYIVADKARFDPRTKEFTETYFIPHQIYGKLSIIVRKKGAMAGMLCFEHGDQTRTWEPEELLFVTALSDLTSLALEEHERSLEEARRKQLEEQLFQSQKLESLGALAGGIAHDFNNLLSAILGSIELAELRLQANQDIHPQLQTIHQAGARARELVRQILAFSRKTPLTMQPLSLEDAILSGLELLQASLTRSISLELQLNENKSQILGTATQIHQILINLVTNASHAIGDEPGRIVIGTKRHHFLEKTGLPNTVPHACLQPGEHIEIFVKDSGHGMPESMLQSIFDPFFTTKDVGQGTGLGLSIVHTVTRNLNGAVTVESSLEHGTIFHVYIPIVSQRAEQKSSSSLSPVKEPTKTSQKSIMIVDDESSSLIILRKILEKEHYHVSQFQKPEEALAAFEENPTRYLLVITDQMMPVMTGNHLTERIKRISSSTPIILLSGYPLPERFMEMGISYCLPKPLPPSLLLAAVTKLLNPELEEAQVRGSPT
jgi:PAS domain S-box-containing protein